MRIISIVIYNFSPLPSVIFSADGAENDYLYLRGAVFVSPAIYQEKKYINKYAFRHDKH